MRLFVREWARRLAALVTGRRTDADMEDELRAHLALAEEAGTASPREVALRAGGVDQALERMRDQRGVPWLRDTGRDVCDAARLVTRAPAVAGVVVLSLTLGLTLGMVAVRLINAYVLRGLPYPQAERLYTVTLALPDPAMATALTSMAWESLDDVVEHRIAWNLDMVALLGGEFPETAAAAWVTPGFLEGLGVGVAHGRRLQADDFAGSGPTPVLISHRLWTTRYAASPEILGRPIRAYSVEEPGDLDTFTIVGVLRPDFWHVNSFTDVVGPLTVPSYPYMVRLRPGVNPGGVAGRIETLIRAAAPAVPADWHPRLDATHDRYIGTLRPLLRAAGAVAALVVLIACANVSVLLLVRAVRRQRELALRLALGASRGRLARLLAAEAALLAVASTALALAASRAVLTALAPAIETHVARRVPGGVEAFATDGTVLAAALVVAVAVTVLLTAIPLAATTWPALGAGLLRGGRGDTDGRTARRLRGGLVAAELAGALALLVGATQMIESARRVLLDPVGVRPDVLVADIGLREHEPLDAAARARAFTQAMQEISARLGGAPIALGGRFPLQPTPPRPVATAPAIGRAVSAAVLPVSAGYFAALGIDLSDGTSFAEDDRPGGAPVAVVSASLAARLWPGARAVGQWLHVSRGGPPDTTLTPHRVVGVAADVQDVATDAAGVATDADRLDVYVPLLQASERFAFMYIREGAARAEADPLALVRRAVATVDAEAAVSSLRSLGPLVDAVRGRPRRLAWLLSVLAAASTLLAVVGVYGVVAYAVRQRQREIGVRMALGAAPREVTTLFLREGARLLLTGLAAGVLAALAIGRTLQSQLVGVAATEPRAIAAALLALGLTGALAFWWPARRASRVAPAEVLRCE